MPAIRPSSISPKWRVQDKRPTDIVARIGGDEFVMLLPETDVQQASVVAERLRQKVAQSPTGEPGAEMKMTISIGVASATLSMPASRRC